ncbi:MAG: hypothetical protein NTU81_01200 [Candidatus Nomurabacteria bacterium]|nr:hypothetical protein [Candidatus Nomurabacteria bacterium]
MSWALKRQLQYFSGLVIFIGLIVFALIYPIIFKKPTCFDSQKNGDETGIDCGGSCLLMCREEISTPVVIWNRSFHVVGSTYNLVAFVENRNKTAGVIKAPYEFRIYDANNKLLGRREGSTFIPPNQQFAVFEPRFDSGQNEIKTVTFEFLPNLTWIKKLPTLQTLKINVDNIIIDNNKNTPSLSAVVNNNSIYDVPEFDVIAILYDVNHNAINASKTHRNSLLNNTSTPIVFTWPEALSSEPSTNDIIVLINPFLVSF